MKVALWVSGKLNGQTLLTWAKEQGFEPVVLVTMNPEKFPLAWATQNIEALKKVSDENKIDLIFKSVKKTGDENFAAVPVLLKYAKTKYGAEAVAVEAKPEIAHQVSNAAKHLGLKLKLLPK